MRAVGLCDHCGVELVGWRAWPAVGVLADCPSCRSSFLRKHTPAWYREDLLLAAQGARITSGPVLADLDRWIRGWCVVAAAYKREADYGAAKRCEDLAITLLHWQRGGAVQVEAVLA